MAKVPTPKESANLILQRFKINHLRAGGFSAEGFTSEDLQQGLDYASVRGLAE
jgi:hypothetical protein